MAFFVFRTTCEGPRVSGGDGGPAPGIGNKEHNRMNKTEKSIRNRG